MATKKTTTARKTASKSAAATGKTLNGADITPELLQSLLGEQTVNRVSQTTKADSSQIQQVIAAALPLLISGMTQNAQNDEGAESLSNAMDQHAAKDHSDIVNLIEQVDAADGKKVVGHVLGDKEKDITKALSKKTGLTTKQVISVLAIVAPILLTMLGKKKQEHNVQSNQLGGLLGSLLGGEAASTNNNNGFGLDDVASLLLGGGSQSSSSSLGGSLLSGLLGGGSQSSSNTASLGGSLLGSLLGGGSSSNSSSDSTGELLGSLLGSLLK